MVSPQTILNLVYGMLCWQILLTKHIDLRTNAREFNGTTWGKWKPIIKWRDLKNVDKLKNEDNLKNEDYLKIEDDLKNEDNLKCENNLEN